MRDAGCRYALLSEYFNAYQIPDTNHIALNLALPVSLACYDMSTSQVRFERSLITATRATTNDQLHSFSEQANENTIQAPATFIFCPLPKRMPFLAQSVGQGRG